LGVGDMEKNVAKVSATDFPEFLTMVVVIG
jgi:hypothetical protein